MLGSVPGRGMVSMQQGRPASYEQELVANADISFVGADEHAPAIRRRQRQPSKNALDSDEPTLQRSAEDRYHLAHPRH